VPDYSVVIPVHNEEGSLETLFEELQNELRALGRPYEIIFVDDCSSDASPKLLARFRQRDPSVKIVTLSPRSGQTFAMKQGFAAAKGEFVITLDADLQNDPADIPKLLDKMQEGYDVVCGWRKARQDRPLKMVLSKLGNLLQRRFTGMDIHDVSCTLRVYRRKCLPDIALDWEGQHRFIPVVLSRRGYKVGEIVSHHRKRRFDTSKYGHDRILRVVADFFRVISSQA